MSEHVAPHGATSPARLASLSLGALGVVFGDIGTSPLYAFKECLNGPHGVAATPTNVLGALSLIFWSLMLIVTLKYLTFIMRCDNHGEGGIFALLAQLPDPHGDDVAEGDRSYVYIFTVLGVLGASLLYGDGIVTPAISVLSAIEGLELAAPGLEPVVVPITCGVLISLFAIQRFGTGHIGRLFGPLMLGWFLLIGTLGAVHIAAHPSVLAALSPHHAVAYFAEHGVRGILILGAVVLSVTGGEALYADMGHFGVRPIRRAWFVVVLPALLLAYLGQGALVLNDPQAAGNPFFAMVPPGLPTYALVGIASLSTVIASQALISGVFSLTKQAIQLGYLPRMKIMQTAWETEGQIYVPAVNWGLAIACVMLVLTFRSSGRLAAAYGIAVSGTMAFTSLVFFEVVRTHWRWPLYRALPLLVMLLSFDLPFLVANAFKIVDGGYVPVLVAGVVALAMLVWKRGQALFSDLLERDFEPLADFVARDAPRLVARGPGVGVYLARNEQVLPPALQKQVRAVPALQGIVIVMSVRTTHVPAVAPEDQMEVESLGHGFYRVAVRSGFMEQPDIPALLQRAASMAKITIDPDQTTYYLRRETFLASPQGEMGRVTEGIFSFLARNARPLDGYFKIPPSQVFEVGTQFDL